MTVRARTLHVTAKRIGDEQGKGQEILRKAIVNFSVDNVARTQYKTFILPDVNIKIVDISVLSMVKLTGSDTNTLDVFKGTVASATALITQFDPDTLTAGTPVFQTLATDGSVAAGTIVFAKLANGSTAAGAAAAPTDVAVEVSYILADEDQRTYQS